MNARQFMILILTIAIIAAIFYFSPRYKIVSLGGEGNYIRTQQRSPLFEKCKAPASYDWDKIFKAAIPVSLLGLFLIIILRDRKR